MVRVPLFAFTLLAAASPSALAAQTAPTVAQYEQEMAKVRAAIAGGRRGDFVVERKVNGEAVPTVLTQDQFRAFVVQMVMTDEIDPAEVPAFIKAARDRSDRNVEDLEEQLIRLDGNRMKAAVAEGGETLTRVRAEMYTPEYLAGIGVGDIDKLHPAARYDLLIARTGGMIERGQAGDFILIQEINGKRMPVAVTPSQLTQVVTELIMLGELDPGEAADFVAAARVYTVNTLQELKDIRQGLTEKRDNIVRDIENEIRADGEAMARIAAEVKQSVPASGTETTPPPPPPVAPPPPPPPPSGPVLDWSGTYVDSQNEYVVTGGGASLAAQGRTVHGNKATGNWSDCAVFGNKALCAFSGTYEDADKSATYTGIADLTLSADGISGTHRLIGVNVSWRSAPYNTAFHEGAVFPFTLTRKR